jgi:ABC-2 type transport system permease protein
MIRSVLTVARREVRSYFDQPTAYVLVVAFLGLSLFLGFRNMYASGAASLRPFFQMLPILFAVFVPAATMRSLAEERRGRTLEWLVSQPLTETEIVLGKFLGDWAFVLIALAGSIPTAIGLLMVSKADPGIMVAQYFGAALLAGEFVALGLWASSFTRNQITAFIVAAVGSFLFYLIGLRVAQIGVPASVANGLAQLSVLSHFEDVARGVIDLRDVLYFVSVMAFFMVLAVTVLGRDRLSHARADYKRLRLGAVVLGAFVLVLNLLGSHVRGRLDLTRGHLYTLASGTRQVLGNLNDVVQVKLFVSSDLPPEVQLQLRDVRDLLSDLRHASDGKLKVTELHPDQDVEARAEAQSYDIEPVQFNVMGNNGFQVKRGYYGLAVLYADKKEVIPVIEHPEDLELDLVSDIYSMTTNKRPAITFASGFGASTIGTFPALKKALSDRYDIRYIDLSKDTAPPLNPDSLKVLVVAGPTQPVDSVARKRIEAFVDSGGGALFLLNPVMLNPQEPVAMRVKTGLNPLLEKYGVRFDSGMVEDPASSENVSLGRQGLFQVIHPYPLWPVVHPAGDNPITRNINGLSLAWSGALQILDSAKVTPLWQTTKAAGMRSPDLPIMPDQDFGVPKSQQGVRTVAVAIDPGKASKQGRMVVVANETFVQPRFARNNPGNQAFVSNAIDWLAENEALMSIRSKDRTPPPLTFTSAASRNLLKWGNLAGMPLLFVLVGLVRVTGRRRRAESRWKEVVS